MCGATASHAVGAARQPLEPDHVSVGSDDPRPSLARELGKASTRRHTVAAIISSKNDSGTPWRMMLSVRWYRSSGRCCARASAPTRTPISDQ
jgi:hypothetical protein